MSDTLHVEIHGLKEMVRDARQAGLEVDPLMRATLTNSAIAMQREIRVRASHRTGNMQRGVEYSVTERQATVEDNVKYATWVEHGTGVFAGNGRIYPRSKKALAFSMGGKNVVVKSIKGMKARPFFQPGVEASLTHIDEAFKNMADMLLARMGGH